MSSSPVAPTASTKPFSKTLGMALRLHERCPRCGSPHFRPLDCEQVKHYAECCQCGTAWDAITGETVPADITGCATVFRQREPFSEEERLDFAQALERFFRRLGMRTDTPQTMHTPLRFVDAMIAATEGYDGDPRIRVLFETECGTRCEADHIVEGPIPFFSICEHHGLPIQGRAYVGYIAAASILGLSKLTRIVRVTARRFTSQERIGYQILDTTDKIAKPRGVAVILVARHLCTQMRGVREDAAETRTIMWHGAYENNVELQKVFLELIGGMRTEVSFS